ncbi:MAG: restriction endonuclease subunit S [Patescibacteria group bacterium]
MKNNQLQKNIPEGWQELKLASIFEFKNGLNKEKHYFGHGTPIINYTDVYKGGGLYTNTILGRVDVNKSELDRFNVKKGDVFFTRTSETLKEIGFSAVALDDFKDTVFSGFVLRARPKGKSLTLGYSKYYFKTHLARKEIIEKSSYTTRALTSGTSLNHVNIKLPSTPEQNRIVAVLEAWDKAIEKLRKKIEIKKEIKKGLMQDLLTGKKRLGWLKDKWESIRLGDACEMNPKSESLPNTFVYIDLESVERGNLLKENIINLTGAPSRAQRLLRHEDIIFQVVRPYQKNNLFFDKKGDYVASTGYAQIRAKGSARYLYYLLHTDEFVNKVIDRCTGSNYPAINCTDLSEIEIVIPTSKEEQTAVATILTTADNEISKLENKLSLLKDQKKYLLNNLITGTIRTPETLSINK